MDSGQSRKAPSFGTIFQIDPNPSRSSPLLHTMGKLIDTNTGGYTPHERMAWGVYATDAILYTQGGPRPDIVILQRGLKPRIFDASVVSEPSVRGQCMHPLGHICAPIGCLYLAIHIPYL
jgi:hypothetical protein